MTETTVDCTTVAVSLPAPDDFGSVKVSADLDELGQPQGYLISCRIPDMDTPVFWLAPNLIIPLQKALDWVWASCSRFPRAEEYLEHRHCPQCNVPLEVGSTLGGGPCYECEEHNEHQARERVGHDL